MRFFLYSAGLYGLTKNLALDVAPIPVNLVSPGPVDAELWEAMGQDKDQIFEDLKKKLPVREIPRPEGIAEAYLYCMKDRGFTGGIITSTGGGTLNLMVRIYTCLKP
jgi:NAD(P)-dependent dehydrogenase (short-subunit alcohol dehydrogenase family)